jgi:subtilisin family serine protease
MPKGFSLHIGVNKVDQTHYGGLPELLAAVNDAKTMQQFATKFGYERILPLHNSAATAQKVLETLSDWSKELTAGDILLLTFSGHGGQIDDKKYYTDGDRGTDETWCLYDRQLIDDELYEAFQQFKDGVRILVFSDSCHSGTVIRGVGDDDLELTVEGMLRKLEKKKLIRLKEMVGNKPYSKHFTAVYKPIQERLKTNTGNTNRRIGAAVKLFAACQDNQKAYDGAENGRFTGMLKELWGTQMLNPTTSSAAMIKILTDQYQYPTPNMLDYGAVIPTFHWNFPMTINIPDADRVAGYRNPPSDESILDLWSIAEPADAPPQPLIQHLMVTITFTKGDYDPGKLFPLLPPGVKGMRFPDKDTVIVEYKNGAFGNVWDIIYAVLANAEKNGIAVEVEPAQTVPVPVEERKDGDKSGVDTFGFRENWPPMTNAAQVPFAWHLGAEYSQLAEARDQVMAEMEAGRITQKVRIAHFDTGYFPTHPAIWDNPNILRDLARSFVPGESNNKAIDIFYGGNENQGHGLGTLALLAGWKMPSEYTNGENIGYLGAAPCAEVIPMRVGDSVIVLDSESVVEAIDYAIETCCEVITMSRGGKPSAKMARAINKAYEAGIVIVTAAGNSMVEGNAKIGPRTVIWPARFSRVIAACGVCQNHYPYDFEAQKKFARTRSNNFEYMQGNWGPASVMQYAVAAYTPNVPWAEYRSAKPFRKSGGGTSSATPQVAATAALYIMKHRAELAAKGYYQPGQQWKKVEAVRRAIFAGAHLPPNFPEAKQFFGNGILKAMAALNTPVITVSDDMKMPKAESSWFGLTEAIGLFIDRRRATEPEMSATQQQAIAMEISHVLLSDPKLADLNDQLAYETGGWDNKTTDKLLAEVKKSPFASAGLKEVL